MSQKNIRHVLKFAAAEIFILLLSFLGLFLGITCLDVSVVEGAGREANSKKKYFYAF